MKHNIKIILIILGMFVITQLLGLYVVNHYFSNVLPLGFEVPQPQNDNEFNQALASLIFAFIVAILLILLFSKLRIEFVLRLWFFVVIS
ncbi:hypothetical protein HYT24_02330, partial [Candidatus Pacearchaeota archaeon]|nr:hypothetical protein [Candidatus Pacearchaeota archaeon]